MKTDPPSPSSAQPQRPTGKVFDVRRPGKAIASPTSRPVIVGHQADAARNQISVSGIGEPEKLLDSRQKIELAPTTSSTNEPTAPTLTASTAPATSTEPAASTPAPPETEPGSVSASLSPTPDTQAPTSTPDTDMPQVNEASLAELAAEPTTDDPLPAEPASPAASPPAAASTQPAQTVASPFTQEELDAATAQAAAMGMPAEGPVIGDHTSRHLLRTLLIIVALIGLAAFVFDILLDSGVLTINAIPHTHFFGM